MMYLVQGLYSSTIGWEDVTGERTLEEARETLTVYNENEPEYHHRITTEEE